MSRADLLGVFLLCVTIAWLLCPLVRTLALRCRAIDVPGGRKIHTTATPRFGGIALLPAVLAGVAVAATLDGNDPFAWRWAGSLISGSLLVAFVGMCDDRYDFGATPKLLLELLAAAGAWAGGFRITTLALPIFGTFDVGAWGFVLTLVWIVAVTNALNLLDGLDGLTAGVAALAAISLAWIGQFGGAGPVFTGTALALTGACLGFLAHNVHRTRMFLGDSGSLLIGFLLACLSLASAPGGHGPAPVLLPAIVLSVPLIDMVVCFARRLAMGRSPFDGDCGHIHHLFLSTGIEPPRVVLGLYALTAGLGVSAIALAHEEGRGAGRLLLVVMLGAALIYYRFGYFSWRLLRDGRMWNRRIASTLERRSPPAVSAANLSRSVSAIARDLGLSYLRVDVRADDDASARTLCETGDADCDKLEYSVSLGDRRVDVALGNGEPASRLFTRRLLLMPLLERVGEAEIAASRATEIRRSAVIGPGPHDRLPPSENVEEPDAAASNPPLQPAGSR